MNDLKPCPFCGGEATIRYEQSFDVYYIHCDTCNAETGNTGLYLEKGKAIEAWNTRAERTCEIEDCYFEDVHHLHLAMDTDEWFGASGKCSSCGEYIPVMNYCPNCGARVVLAND